MTGLTKHKPFRTYFHVKPLKVLESLKVFRRRAKRSAKVTRAFRLDWICEADRPTRTYLKDVFDLTVGDKQTFPRKATAMAMAKSLCMQFKPSERVEHRLPDRSKGERGFPIVDRSTYGSDPHPPAGVLRKAGKAARRSFEKVKQAKKKR